MLTKYQRTRVPAATAVDERPGRYDVADGGVYVMIGDQEIAVTSPKPDDDDRTHESLLRARAVLQALADNAPAALAEIDAVLAALGVTCPRCDGSKIQTTGPESEVDCPACDGSGRVAEPQAA